METTRLDPRWAREIRTVARWWGDRLRERVALVRSATSHVDLMHKIGVFAADDLWDTLVPTIDEINRFEQALVVDLDRVLSQPGMIWDPADPWATGPDQDRLLMTDYDPDATLTAAAAAAGITRGEWFPMKSWTRYDPGRVEASLGYGGPAAAVPLLPDSDATIGQGAPALRHIDGTIALAETMRDSLSERLRPESPSSLE